VVEVVQALGAGRTWLAVAVDRPHQLAVVVDRPHQLAVDKTHYQWVDSWLALVQMVRQVEAS
jgi:hypothetical protein